MLNYWERWAENQKKRFQNSGEILAKIEDMN